MYYVGTLRVFRDLGRYLPLKTLFLEIMMDGKSRECSARALELHLVLTFESMKAAF